MPTALLPAAPHNQTRGQDSPQHPVVTLPTCIRTPINLHSPVSWCPALALVGSCKPSRCSKVSRNCHTLTPEGPAVQKEHRKGTSDHTHQLLLSTKAHFSHFPPSFPKQRQVGRGPCRGQEGVFECGKGREEQQAPRPAKQDLGYKMGWLGRSWQKL